MVFTSKIFRRFLLVFLALSLLPLITATWIILKHSVAEAHKQALIQLRIVADGVESEILEYLNYLKSKTAGFCSDKFIISAAKKRCQNPSFGLGRMNRYLLRDKLPTFSDCIETFILDLKGRVVASSHAANTGRDFSGMDFFIQGQKAVYISDVFHEPETQQIGWVVSAPLTCKTDNTLVGVLVNRINPKTLSDITTGRASLMLGAQYQSARMGMTGETYLVNRGKLMITESRFLDDVILKQAVDTEIVRFTLHQGETTLTNYPDYRGVPVIGASMFIRELGWTLVAEMDFAEAFAHIRKLRAIVLIGAGVLIPVIFFITWMLTARFTRPVMRLIKADSAVIQGDQTLAFIREDEIPDNELGDVMCSRNDMLTNLKEMKALVNSQERYRLLVENIPDIIWTTDRSGNTTFVSPQVEKIYGYTQNEIYEAGNRLWFGRIHPRDVDGIKESFESLFTSNKTFDIEYRLRKKDGSWIWVHDRAIRIYEKEGVQYAEGVLTDITGKKRIEQRRNVLYAVSRVLAESPTLDKATLKILQAICEALEWDVGAFWIADRNNQSLRCVELWHRPSAHVPEFELLSRNAVFPVGVGLPGRVYADCKPTWITDVVCDPNFPRSPIAIKEGLHGAFGFPVLIDTKIHAVVEFFSREIQSPDEDLLKMMASIGSQIGQFIIRKQSENALVHRIEFEKTVARISSRFVMLSDFSRSVSNTLADAGKLSRASRAYIFQFSENGSIMSNTHEWCDEGVTPEIQGLQRIPSATFPWLMANLQAGKVIHIDDVSRMPPGAANEKAEFERENIKSVLILPMYVENILAGFAGFDNIRTTGAWDEQDVTMLRIIAEIIGNALARKQSEDRISYMAYHDALTELPNRALFQDRLKIAISHAKRNNQRVSVLMLDLDNFKAINDTLGHHIGDLLLKIVAGRLINCVRGEDTIARMGGDEFMVIINGHIQEQDISLVAQKILDVLNNPFQIEGHEIRTTASIGVSIYPLNSDSPEGLIKLADIAMYASKKEGKNTYHFYKPEMNNHA